MLIDLDVPENELINRMIHRGKATGRTDDNPETIKKRLAVYNELTFPVIQFYQKLNKYVSIQGLGKVDDIFKNICLEIDKHVVK